MIVNYHIPVIAKEKLDWRNQYKIVKFFVALSFLKVKTGCEISVKGTFNCFQCGSCMEFAVLPCLCYCILPAPSPQTILWTAMETANKAESMREAELEIGPLSEASLCGFKFPRAGDSLCALSCLVVCVKLES